MVSRPASPGARTSNGSDQRSTRSGDEETLEVMADEIEDGRARPAREAVRAGMHPDRAASARVLRPAARLPVVDVGIARSAVDDDRALERRLGREDVGL